MSTLNPDQLKFIPSAPTRDNPARYGDSVPAVNPAPPTVVIGPNPTYLVDPARQVDKPAEPEPPNPEPGPPPAPVLSFLDPSELPVWAQDTEVLFNGDNFTENSVIIWNNGEEPTTFINSEQLSTIVKPSTVQVAPPFAIEAYVLDGENESEKLTFTFIA